MTDNNYLVFFMVLQKYNQVTLIICEVLITLVIQKHNKCNKMWKLWAE